jgi:hypothetical protein
MDTVEYWDRQWENRIVDSISTKGNWDKYKVLATELCKRPYLSKLKKIEIGAGVCSIALQMSNVYSNWLDDYKAIEQSPKAVEWCRDKGINAVCADFMTFETDEKFDLFLFFDVLEHIEDVEALAEKVKSMASDKFRVIGNIPLYTSEHDPEEGYERLMNVNSLNEAMALMGCSQISHYIYGSHGFPYMMWEAYNEN